jgi:hypothetical protein
VETLLSVDEEAWDGGKAPQAPTLDVKSGDAGDSRGLSGCLSPPNCLLFACDGADDP